mmetsp:Transcript_5328/g.7943  ORF Transcript_5328/g.7943 Transcript_5328/m.7943 type:complete len:334 (+) Transcript_5328:3-1004(+)
MTFHIIIILVIVAWSCLCAFFADNLRQKQQQEHGWLGWLENIDVKVIGTLFTFSLVYRFNVCYSRWWQGRLLWGNIITQCIDFSEKASLWIIDHDYADRLNRLIIVFPYVCKAQLRGVSICDPSESGEDLIRRNFLTLEELDYLEANPCWQPYYFLDIMRAIIAKVIIQEYDTGNTLLLPKANKIHEKLFKPLDQAVEDLARSMGECISVRTSGLPKSYDVAHYAFFCTYFIVAPVVWSTQIGWVTPILAFPTASITLALISMGSSLVDPFGSDFVDLPLDKFCECVEAQISAIQRRSKDDTLLHFAEFSTTEGYNIDDWASTKLSSSVHICE